MVESVQQALRVIDQIRHAPFRAGSLRADGVAAMVHGDACDPMLEGNPPLELFEVLEHLQENLLGEILLGGSPGEVSPNDSRNQGVQELNELPGCLIVAGTNPRQKGGRCGRGRGGRSRKRIPGRRHGMMGPHRRHARQTAVGRWAVSPSTSPDAVFVDLITSEPTGRGGVVEVTPDGGQGLQPHSRFMWVCDLLRRSPSQLAALLVCPLMGIMNHSVE